MFRYLLLAFFTTVVAHDIHILLRQRNVDVLYEHLQDTHDSNSVNFLNFLTTAEIKNIVSPPQQTRDNIVNFLVAKGCASQSQIRDGGDVISFPAHSVGPNCSVLQTGKFPKHLQDNIDFVLGLKGYNRICPVRPPSLRKSAGNQNLPAQDGYVGREVIERLYNTSNLSGNIGIGVVQYDQGEGFYNADLNSYQTMNGLPVNNVSKAHRVGGYPGFGGEGELDIQMISNLQNADLWFFMYDGWIYDFANDFFHRKEYPTVISHSYGWSERDQCTIVNCFGFTSADYVRRTNVELAKVALRGVTMMVSSGDAGSLGRTDEFCSNKTLEPVFPGSSPWVVSVGATFVAQNNSDNQVQQNRTQLCQQRHCVNGTTEQETSFNATSWTSGSGFGVFSERQNTWQEDFVQMYLRNAKSLPPTANYNRAGRAYPDVSAIGHLCTVFRSGVMTREDGTSCSSPVFAALVGYLSSKLNSRLGLLTPMLYNAYAQNPAVFHDITEGHSECTESRCCSQNMGFQAGPGWDPVGGLGTPNIGLLLESLDNMIVRNKKLQNT